MKGSIAVLVLLSAGVARAAPTITVTAPLPATVARPSVRVTADCTPACTVLRLGVATPGTSCPGDPLVAGGATIDQDVSLAAYANLQVQVCLEGTDGIGEKGTAAIDVYVDPTPTLQEVETVPGLIQDISETRLLYQSAASTMKLKARNGAELGTVPDGDGRLFSTGVLHWGASVSEWKDGQDTVVGELFFILPSIRGERAAWVQQDGRAVIRTFGAGTETLDSMVGYTGATVTVNGDVLLVGRTGIVGNQTASIWRRAGGTNTLVRTCSGFCRAAFSDGKLVVFRQMSLLPPSQVYLLGDPTDQLLGQSRRAATPLVTSDWIAYESQTVTSDIGATTRHVFLRSPAGQTRQLTTWEDSTTPLSNDSTAEALNADGEVMLLHDRRRYLVRLDQAPLEVSSALGAAHWLAGAWYVTIGRTLFRVAAPPPADGGADGPAGVDAAGAVDGPSAPDGGVDAAAALVDGGPGTGGLDAATDRAGASEGSCSCTLGARPRRPVGVLLLALLALRRRQNASDSPRRADRP
jgi:hypothetical protein